MSWKYGIVKTKLEDGKNWFYLAEIYKNSGHTDSSAYGSISAESIEELIDTVETILGDLKESLTVVDEIK